MDYQVRTARITDVERLAALLADGDAPTAGANAAVDVLRQLVYLPQASVLVVESHRRVVGGAVLSLRPSVAAGANVGVVDALALADGVDDAGVTDALLGELLRSARNKGCRVVEAVPPANPALRARWGRLGFVDAGARLTYTIGAPQARAT